MTVFSDSNYAGDTETRISMTGFCVFLMCAQSAGKVMCREASLLSSSEATFVAMSKAAKEIKVIVQVLLSIGIKVLLPVIVCIDNVGSILMAKNVSTKTKHVDVCYHFD